jgi:hypothetical protein
MTTPDEAQDIAARTLTTHNKIVFVIAIIPMIVSLLEVLLFRNYNLALLWMLIFAPWFLIINLVFVKGITNKE